MSKYFYSGIVCFCAFLGGLMIYGEASAQYYSGQYGSPANYGCVNECNLGDHQCSGNSGRTCRNFGNCSLWDNYDACDSRCYTCGDGSCNSACGESRTSCPRDCGYETDQYGQTNYDRNYNRDYSNNYNCNNAPRVDAGENKYVNSGESVLLEGSASGDYNRVSWSCDGGRILDNASAQATWQDNNYNNYNYNGNYERSYSCTITARGNCGSDSDSMTIRVRKGYNDNYPDSSNIRVALIISPKTACAPVRGADLTATVSNYGNRNSGYTYYFDCENDGVWEKTVNTDEPSYTARDLCDYVNMASYTARVRVESQGRTVTDTDIIKADDCGYSRYRSNYQTPQYYPAQNNNYPYQVVAAGNYQVYQTPSAQIPNSQINIQKTVSNLSNGTKYGYSVAAQPRDIVSYKIIVTGVSGNTSDIVVKDSLPASLADARDLRIDGVSSNGDIAAGINIGSLGQGQTRIITFTATLADENSFIYGKTSLTNAANVYAGSASAVARATITVNRGTVAGATAVATGFTDNLFGGIGIALAGIAITMGWLLARYSKRRKMPAKELLIEKINYLKKNRLV